MEQFYIIGGDDDFLRKRRALELADELSEHAGEDDPVLDIIASDGANVKIEALLESFIDSLRTPPFLTPFKVVWLKHFPDFDIFAKEDPPPIVKAALENMLAPLPENVRLLIDGTGLDQRKSFVKALKKAGATVETYTTAVRGDKNSADRRRIFIEEFFAAAGKNLAFDALRYLQEVLSGDSGILTNELQKLLCYVGDATEITLDDCTRVISRTPEAMSWEYTSAIVAGETESALSLLGMILRSGAVPIQMLYSVSNEFQRLIQTRQAMRELGLTRVNPRTFDSLADKKAEFPNNPLLKYKPYRAFKVCESALAVSEEKLAQKLNLIRNAARGLVSGDDQLLALEQLTIALCAK